MLLTSDVIAPLLLTLAATPQKDSCAERFDSRVRSAALI
jgi:hypothetical protein